MRALTWYEVHYNCNRCIGCDRVADGEGNCLCEEDLYNDEEEW